MPAPAAIDRPAPAPQPAPTFDPLCVAREGLDLWFAACSAWTDYFTALSRSTGPAAAFDAQARLLAESLDLCGRAAASRLESAGVTTPLLNDP